MRKDLFPKKHFFAGLLVVIPIGVIAWIFLSLIRMLWKFNQFLPTAWQPQYFLADQPALALFLHVLITLGLAATLGIGIALLGWASELYLGSKILEIFGHIIERIPVIRTIYSSLDQLLRTLTAKGGQQFSRVVYVEFPKKGSWTLAFVTGSAPSQAFTVPHLNIYVPTTPNPTSGFYLIVPENEVKESHLKVEEAFKTILSLGIAQASELKSDRPPRS